MSDRCCSSGHGHAHADAETASAAIESASVGTAARLRRAAPVVSGACIAAGMALSALGRPIASRILYGVAIALSMPTPAARAWRSLRRGALDINVLMVIASTGAMLLGDWVEAASVVWLFGAAQWLEARSSDRVRRAISALLSVVPDRATVRRADGEREIATSAIVAGDVVIVRPGDRLPADGVVLAGASSVNQSAVTGEAWPVDKTTGDEVFAGTVNGDGALEVEVRSAAGDSLIARIRRTIERADRERAPVQTAVDRFARAYTPVVILLAVATALLPPFFSALPFPQAFALWSYRALALLVVACPCALVISTPVSIVSALAAAAREGVLIKGGAHLQRLATITCVAFDKTGTLTTADVGVTDVLGVDGVSSLGVLQVAAALESRSEHPVGRAILSHARLAGIVVTPGEGFRALPGFGAEAMVAAAPAVVGSHRLFEERKLCTPSLHARIQEVEGRGATPVLVGHDGAALGVISFADRPREDGRRAVARLRDVGVNRIVLLTGDNSASAAVVRASAGLDEAHANLLPADKVERVNRLRDSHGPVAMVGDGINDAPAMAASDVGIAMGVAGTGAALETADVALMTDDLRKIPYALRLARATLANIRVNLAIALGLKVGFVILAACGVATLWMAVLADTGASILVTANSLRLLRVR